MKELQVTGGARIGSANATFPFAVLKVEKECLELNASVIGNLIFQPSDIISIEPYSGIGPQGLKIIHKVDSYNELVIFRTSKNINSLLEQIKETGFLEENNIINSVVLEKIKEKQKSGGFPYKKSFGLTMIVLWNFLILGGFILPLLTKMDTFLGLQGIVLALGLLFLVALLSILSSNFRGLILKPGRNLEDINRFSYFILLISGIMFIAIGSRLIF